MTKLLKFFLADFEDVNGETIVTLSKKREQKDGPLNGVNFINHNDTIRTNSTITTT